MESIPLVTSIDPISFPAHRKYPRYYRESVLPIKAPGEPKPVKPPKVIKLSKPTKIKLEKVVKSSKEIKRGRERKIFDENKWAFVLYYHARDSATKAGRNFNLTIEWIERRFESQLGKCYYLGVDMKKYAGRGDPFKVSLDKIDSRGGYTIDNVAVCCAGANFAKNCCDIVDFLEFVKAIKSA